MNAGSGLGRPHPEDSPPVSRRGAGWRIRATTRRLAASASWRFGIAAIGSAALLTMTYAVFVLTEPGQRLENIGLLGAQLRGSSVREGSLGYLSQVSVFSFALAILAIVGIAFIRRRPGLGIVVAAVMGGATLLAEVLKEVLPRPELVAGPAWILRNDFPSGHATIAASLGIGAFLVAPDRLRWFVIPAGAAVAAVIGQSAQISGWHRMSSAVGGVLLVIVVASTALFVLSRAGLVQPTSRGRIHPKMRAALLVVPAVAFLIAGAVLALLVAFPLLQTPKNSDSAFLHTVFELLGFGFTILAFVFFARVAEPFSLGSSAVAGSRAPARVREEHLGADTSN
jgi:hypothetical protein